MRAKISCVMSTVGGRLRFIDKFCPVAHDGILLFASERLLKTKKRRQSRGQLQGQVRGQGPDLQLSPTALDIITSPRDEW